MKHILFFLVLLLSFSSHAQKGYGITIGDATVRHWISGAPGGRSGEDYRINICVNTRKAVKFTGMWVGQEKVPFQLQFFNYQVAKEIAPGDSLLLDYNTATKTDASPTRLPRNYKGAALIEYQVAGKAHYFVVKAFKKLPDLLGI